MTHVTYRLIAKNRDQLRNPTLGSRVWATFTLLGSILSLESDQNVESKWAFLIQEIRYSGP